MLLGISCCFYLLSSRRPEEVDLGHSHRTDSRGGGERGFLLPSPAARDIWQCLETFSVIINGSGVGATVLLASSG